MRNTAWLAFGLVGLGCGSPPKIVADNFDSGRDVPTTGVETFGCPASLMGPRVLGDAPRHTFAWTFAAATADAGAGSADTGADAAAPSRCTAIALPYLSVTSESCVGGAWLRSSPSGPVLTFDDGSTLSWQLDGAPTPAPYVQQAGGDRVWADYENHLPFGSFWTSVLDQTLEIRDGASGAVRFYAQQGDDLPGLPAPLVSDIFGVTATTSLFCMTHIVDDAQCLAFDRTELSHELQTSPAATITFAVGTQVAAPSGTYSVLWAQSSETNETATCTDISPPATDNGFVATRLAP